MHIALWDRRNSWATRIWLFTRCAEGRWCLNHWIKYNSPCRFIHQAVFTELFWYRWRCPAHKDHLNNTTNGMAKELCFDGGYFNIIRTETLVIGILLIWKYWNIHISAFHIFFLGFAFLYVSEKTIHKANGSGRQYSNRTIALQEMGVNHSWQYDDWDRSIGM